MFVLLLLLCCCCYFVTGTGGGGARHDRGDFTADVDAWDERGSYTAWRLLGGRQDFLGGRREETLDVRREETTKRHDPRHTQHAHHAGYADEVELTAPSDKYDAYDPGYDSRYGERNSGQGFA